MDTESERYSRQMRLPGFGPEGQERLRGARVLVVGCGALGTVACDYLVRAGIGALTIVDRDLVEPSNLQRQTLFTEQDAARGVPKAEAAKARLGLVNRACRVRAFVDDLRAVNALRYASEVDLIIDALDNFETRAVLNECAVSRRIPLVYGGAVGYEGMAAAILPHGSDARMGFGGALTWDDARSTACLRCLLPELPAPGELPTCDVAGVLGPVAGMVASMQAALAIRLLAQGPDSVPDALLRVDLASMRLSSASIRGARNPECACCARRRFELLERSAADSGVRILCGREAVELSLGSDLDDAAFARLEARVRGVACVERDTHGSTRVLRISARDRADGDEVRRISVLAGETATLALVEGTRDPEQARAAVARWIGM